MLPLCLGYDADYATSSEYPTPRPLESTSSSSDLSDSVSIDGDSLMMMQNRPRLAVYQILLINLPWFGLSLMYLILTVEGMHIALSHLQLLVF